MKKPTLNDIYDAVALNCKNNTDCFPFDLNNRVFQCDVDLVPCCFGNRFFVGNEVTSDDVYWDRENHDWIQTDCGDTKLYWVSKSGNIIKELPITEAQEKQLKKLSAEIEHEMNIDNFTHGFVRTGIEKIISKTKRK